ncbi:interleukin-1 receptor-associated kinase 3 isoform X2 [Entelurus aequoreus]|uniref:interleukin-1 receptor-associated kinase 3 isoform X2 n=1 Tax=Entelurus aequoreus TaxID=161455 RepID=UPI002B1D24FF|nr:interleukin-1 receptor-associated kinase 3 isoform X2 [Entelurus aequoreus]
MEPHTFLYDVPPLVIEQFCQIMDIGCCRYGWRALARICPSFSEVRVFEHMEAGGRSPTKELLWSWAQQNSRVQDLLGVLQDMGHHRASQIFLGHFHAVRGEHQPPVTLQDILKGTRDFHSEAKISEGSFSDIYQAQVEGKTFAVKLFKQVNNTSWKKLWDIFRKQMEVLRLCRHPNILELLGCFSDESRYCLVYPYMHKGSLFHALHHQEGVPPLSWQERLAIIKGVAEALHHLHKSQPCAVICGNLSSSNILLDSAMQPKLSDFGLAGLRPHLVSRCHTGTLCTSSLANLGYLPEEYIRHGRLSCSLDVYSFGMVAMETLTGRKVIKEVPKRTQLKYLLVSEAEDSGVDACLQFLDASAGQWPTSMTRRLLDLSLQCTASHHRDRPSMNKVLHALIELLPPSSCSSLDPPHSLQDGAPIHVEHTPSLPVENDEQHSLRTSASRTGPCECSQSEVTYLSVTEADHVDTTTGDPHKSWPVQCSCQTATGDLCEDCMANIFTHTSTQFSE